MKLAITDACIFIDLIELQLTSEFFRLPLEVHTSLDVCNELYPEQKEILKDYSSVGKLVIHNLTSEEKTQIHKARFPKSLSEVDKTVVFLARKLNAAILSSDKSVRNYAKSETIPYHGILWIFDKLVELNILVPKNAILKIEKLYSKNIIYINNTELLKEKNRRILFWKSL